MTITRTIAAAVLIASLAGCAANPVPPTPDPTPSPAETFTASGTLLLTDGYEYSDATDLCWGVGGYDDIDIGTPVTVTDAAGTVVGIGRLAEAETALDETLTQVIGCRFRFAIQGVTGGSDYYGVEVAERGVVRYDAIDISRSTLELTLGSN